MNNTVYNQPDFLIAELRNRLHSADEDQKVSALETLSAVGERGVSAIPDLLDILLSDNNYYREKAARAMSKMGADGANALIIALQDKRDAVRCQAIYALSWIGPEAESAVSKLNTLSLFDSNKAVREAALHAMRKIGNPYQV